VSEHDPALDLFSDLINPDLPEGQDYPGKRKPANRSTEAPQSVSADWDDQPLLLIYGGEAREWFTIRHLAAALDRKTVTIRSWERKGMMPQTPFRTPPPKNTSLPGAAKGRRLWTREQIEGILRIAKEEGVIVDQKQSPPTERFAVRVARLFAVIKAKEVEA
jgi:hypothetical protein